MAAYCPKCNYKLKLTDWRAECPKCGVNILYYGIEDELRREADTAEYHYALRQPKFDRLKFSLIGHPLSIVRLVLGLLPIVALLLPMGTVNLTLPFGSTDQTVNLVSIISYLTGTDLDLGLVGKLFGSGLVGKGIACWAVAIVCLVLIALISLVGFFLLTLSCSPRGMKRNLGFPIAGMVCATVSFVAYIMMVNSLGAALSGVFAGTVNPAAYIAVMCCFAAMIAVNVIYKKKNIQVKYKDVSEFLIPYEERPSTIEKKRAQQAEPEQTSATTV